MERRSFLKMSAAMGCAATVAGCNSSSSDVDVVPPTPPVTEGETMNWSSCLVNCGSNCPVRVYSKDGVITRIESQFTTEDTYGNHDVRACLRGRSLRKRVYAPERLKYPMKRVGPRGSGQFERISWDEALNTVAERLQGIIDQYGNESIFDMTGTGTFGHFKSLAMVHRLLNAMGGSLKRYGVYSYAQLFEASRYTYGTPFVGLQGSTYSEMQHSDLVLFVGHNPSELRMSGSGQGYDFLNQKQTNNFKTIIIDPRYTDTAVGKEDQWIAIRPGTDAALFEALAYEWITQGKVDQAFLNKYCVGYDEKTLPEGVDYGESYKSYILDNATIGELTPGDNAKTPAWAAGITGIPEHTIIELARELAAAKAPFIKLGLTLNRHAAGENNMRAGYMLPILLGQLGLPGTNNGGDSSGGHCVVPRIAELENPVKKEISFFTYLQAVEDGKNMTVLADGVRGVELDENGDGKLGTDIKAIVNWFSNSMINQHSDVRKSEEVIKDESLCEFILTVDNIMTPSAKFSDIILPDTTWLEDEELVNQNHVPGDTGTVIQMSSGIEPLFESRHSYDICTEIAKRMGCEQAFTEGKTMQQWLNEMYAMSQAANPGLPDKEVMLKQGIYRKYLPHGSQIAMKGFRDDPEANRLYTPSGKIEIYSSRLAHKAKTWELREGDVISALPKYTPTWDGYEDSETREKYPLQLTCYHTKGRVHSSYHNIPWLREVVQDAVWMNPIDAQARNLKTGDLVHVFNDRGTLEVEVKVTPRIMIGVTALGQGAWSKFEDGIDKGGNVNTITSQRPTPLSKGNPQHTNRVEIRRA
ncbi:anaerobic dimethyl sulfoxide reductase, A subunit, DmsA/YnfE family protein [Shewanella sediminis HAW-EB3]|uniref:Anaerobic dimethyl sulfoxide reductase, A subunit, DmsA/YnfE family protein n=2 Tax=Shewanella TaxID=22 RepID=A8FXF7_SHESH|nr:MULTISPECIES: DMSO/selenate family reductase complex A subunit [Shewanella]ABV37530.1 anaerobic dimethyl sulfoxide reductase, A subunit, DmsA/YnfE family protein [Shewanella sediminis HAW-EB3]RTR36759.1 twin-arginine translocation signal domain-containing protein [Shewanella canadensis]